MKKIVLLLLLTLFAYSESIDNYLVDLNIDNSGRINAVEEIDYNFGNTEHHGIYRDIPLNNTDIKNIRVLQNGMQASYTTSRLRDGSNEYERIKIGNANSYVTGLVNYKISYTIDGYIVRNSGDKNKIIVDLIGTGWRVPIRNVVAKVNLPSNIANSAKIKVYRGAFGSTDELEFKKQGRVVVIKTANLAPHEGITISLTFDKTLIKADKNPDEILHEKFWDNPIYYIFILPIIALFIYFGKKFNIFGDNSSIPVKYRAPKDLTLLEAGLLKDNFVDFEELKPAILELANLGFIKMNNKYGELYLERTSKSSNSLQKDQKLLLDEIFGEKNEISANDIKITDSFFNNIKDIVHSAMISKGFFNSSIRRARDSFVFLAILITLVSIGVFLYYILKESGGMEFIYPFLFMTAFVGVGTYMLINSLRSRDFMGMIFSIIWIGISILFMYNVIYSKELLIAIAIIIAIAAIGIYFIYKNMNTLSFKGIIAKRNLLGLKEFIAKAEKDKIAFFLKEDKEYLNKLLPYAMLFGLNKHWLKLYKELDTPLPSWYEGDFSTFDVVDFDLNHYEPSISSSPSIDSSDFGSFGDFGGGGIGGGGGDSW